MLFSHWPSLEMMYVKSDTWFSISPPKIDADCCWFSGYAVQKSDQDSLVQYSNEVTIRNNEQSRAPGRLISDEISVSTFCTGFLFGCATWSASQVWNWSCAANQSVIESLPGYQREEINSINQSIINQSINQSKSLFPSCCENNIKEIQRKQL